MIINQQQILTMTGYKHPGCAEKRLKDQGVQVLHGKDGEIFTTLEAINAVLLDKPVEKKEFEIDV